MSKERKHQLVAARISVGNMREVSAFLLALNLSFGSITMVGMAASPLRSWCEHSMKWHWYNTVLHTQPRLHRPEATGEVQVEDSRCGSGTPKGRHLSVCVQQKERSGTELDELAG